MEILTIRQINNQKLELVLGINGSEKIFRFNYRLEDIFAVDFPEDLRKILRPLPASITQELVKTLKLYLKSDSVIFPITLKTRKLEKLAA